MDGKYIEKDTDIAWGVEPMVVGSEIYISPGFIGVIDSFFVYPSALTVDDLNYLRTTTNHRQDAVPGTAGYALYFGGVNSIGFLRITEITKLSEYNDISITFWIKPAIFSNDGTIIEKGIDSNNCEYKISMYIYIIYFIIFS